MMLLKKYWWVIALVFILIFLFLVSNPSTAKNTSVNTEGNNSNEPQEPGCKEVDIFEWDRKKFFYWARNGNDWGLAHRQLLAEGICEKFS